MNEPVIGVLFLLLQLTFVLPVLHLPASTLDSKPAHSLAVVAVYEMPMSAAADVHWASDGSVLIADLERGVGQVMLPASGKATVSWLPEWPPPTGPDTLVKHLAVSGDRIAAGGLAFLLRWHERLGRPSGQMAVYHITDLDLNGDQLLVSGLRIIRTLKNGMPMWEMALLRGDDSVRFTLPFRSADPFAHVTSDTRGRRTIFLLVDRTVGRGTRLRLASSSWSGAGAARVALTTGSLP